MEGGQSLSKINIQIARNSDYSTVTSGNLYQFKAGDSLFLLGTMKQLGCQGTQSNILVHMIYRVVQEQ